MSVAEYLGKTNALGHVAAGGRPLEGLVEYIITGLNEDFAPIVAGLCARVEAISVGELYSQLLQFETPDGSYARREPLRRIGKQCVSRSRLFFARSRADVTVVLLVVDPQAVAILVAGRERKLRHQLIASGKQP